MIAQRLAAANLPYGVAVGEGDGEVLFLVVSFLVVVVASFLVASVVVADFFVVADFLVVVCVLAGAFSGAVVVAVDSVLLVQELMSPAAKRTVME
jgi:hypothetical protein